MAWKEVNSLENNVAELIMDQFVSSVTNKITLIHSQISKQMQLKYSQPSAVHEYPNRYLCGDATSEVCDICKEKQTTATFLERKRLQREDDEPLQEEKAHSQEGDGSATYKTYSGLKIDCCQNRARIEVLNVLESCRKWWSLLPGASLLRNLKRALDQHTELPSHQDHNFPRHLTCLCLKLLFLDNVFIDRDYGDRDKKCIVPYLWETWLAILVRDMKPLPVRQFSVYGGMFPSVLESMIISSSNISSITISHINITDDLLLTISKFCPNLEKLHLRHCFPWMVISLKYLCAAFFKEKSFEFIWSCLINDKVDKVELSFPHLKEIELNYGDVKEISDYHLLLLSFYKNVKFVHSPWQTNLLESGYKGHCEDVIQESIARTGASSLDRLFITSDYLFELSQDQLRHLLWNLPLLSQLTVGCRTSSSRSSLPKANIIGNKLAFIANESSRIKSLSVNVTNREDLTRAIILPFLVLKSLYLTELTLEASEVDEKIYVSLIKQVMETCETIKRFRVLVWDFSNIYFPLPLPDLIVLPERDTLSEVWLHAGGLENNNSFLTTLKKYLLLINSIIMAAPNLHTLSITVCEGLEDLLSNVSCGVSCLHVHVTDGCEFQPTFEQWLKLISGQPQLQDLYLEEIDGNTLWQLKQKFSTTRLKIHWGTLDGWPRS